MSAPWGTIPFEGAPVAEWPLRTPAPEPPAGMAGVSVWVRNRLIDPPYWGHRHVVGVDDTPMWYGIGRMVAFVPPGEHRAEVRYRGAVQSARTVRVRAGEVAEFEFWTPATYGGSQGVLVPAPARRRMGSGPALLWCTVLVLGAFYLLARSDPQTNAPVMLLATAAAVVGPFLLAWAVSRVKRVIDQRYRVAASAEARETPPGTPGEAMFLGDGDAPAGLADAAHGALVVTCVLKPDHRWNGRTGLVPIDSDPNAWVPAPALTVDGHPRPFGYRTWGYRLTAGPHTLRITPRPPAQAPIGERWSALPLPGITPEIDAPPVDVPVQVAAGQVTRVTITVSATTSVQVIAPSAAAPTVITGFRATVSA
ncbi:hypothetical protein [Catenuloplanes atrovinosus]|uniref:Uncharacterized protein n=1 Tax=Catenuloplanes atrovinosus TaxID=137266 RepID=A0AAE3YP53_9ACTN|nr:hypothetical protein [Catenuloplanes atrovinosus]MDR7275986.1 hypothetical protein [Catenuloplanes atrovinosus]